MGGKLPLKYSYVNVFAEQAFGGNGLPVFSDAEGLSAFQMLKITQELRYFEATFLVQTETTNRFRTRVFDMFEELPFAGHPLLGAGAALHQQTGLKEPQTWIFELPEKTVSVVTEFSESGFSSSLAQGNPEFLGTVNSTQQLALMFSLTRGDLDSHLPVEVVTTGLRYLVVPVTPGALDRARIVSDISELVASCGAQFAVLVDASSREMRHWNNDGLLEDVATGSAAGCVGSYLCRHSNVAVDEQFVLHQGRFLGRPSQLSVTVSGRKDNISNVSVGGNVVVVGSGELTTLP
jgi:trans-2,3-dihydro-3-hydroxyanthranilate isomerase